MKIQVFFAQYSFSPCGLSRPNLLGVVVLGLVVLGFLFNFNQLEDTRSTTADLSLAPSDFQDANENREDLALDSPRQQISNQYEAFTFLGTKLDARTVNPNRAQIKPTPKIKPQEWPPVLGKTFPDFTLWDIKGRPVKLSSLKGKVILVQYVAMSSAAAQAYSGANRLGAYYSINPQRNLRSIFEYVPMYASGVTLANPQLEFVQIILSNMSADAATIEDAQKWSEHFQLNRYHNQHVFVAAPEMRVPASVQLIPGFQLIDSRFRLKADATGSNPRHNLYRDLIPMLGKLVR